MGFNSIFDYVKKYAVSQPDKTAIADNIQAFTYKKLYEKVLLVASALLKRNIKKGASVIVECTQNCEFIILDMAIELIEAVFVPVEAGVKLERLADIYKDTDAMAYISFVERDFSGEFIGISELFENMESIDFSSYSPALKNVAEVLFSTGTTGTPKGIVLSNRANISVAENIKYGTMMHENSVEMVPLPLSHSHGLRTCYAHLLNGSMVVIANGVVNVGEFFSLIEKYGVNALDLAPTMAKVLIQIGKKGLLKYADQIEYIELGTAVLDDFTKEKLKEIFTGTRIYNFYGSTEAGRSCILDIAKEDFTGCVGYPSKNAEFIITDKNRHVIESNKDNIGLVAVKGSMMMDGYFNSPKLTEETLAGGYLYTSDMGYFDEKGRLMICGRADDVINYKGIKIAPYEIEDVAKKYEGIKDCVCVGAEDKICGEVPVLYIELYNDVDIDLKHYKDFLKENLEDTRMPAKMELLDELPRSSNGKILRGELKKRS